MPFEIPESWAWVKLGDIYKHNTGKALNAKDKNGKLRDYITTSNLYWDKFDLTVVKQMLFTDNEVDRCSAAKGDLLVCEGGDIGRSAIWCYDYDICIQNHIHRLRGILPLCNKFYYYILYYYKLSNRIGGKGMAIQGLSADEIDRLLLPLPSVAEQERIVKEIEKWFALIDNIEDNKIDLQEAIKQTKSKILSLAISGNLSLHDPSEEPALELLKGITPEFVPCDISHYQNVPFKIPQNWVWVRHNDVIDLVGGAQPPKSEFISQPKEGYIRLYQIRDYGETPVPVYIPIHMASKITKKGDILLARYGGSLGKVFRAENGAYNVAMIKVVFKYNDLISIDFAHLFYMSSLYQNKLKTISRTAQVGFNESDFDDLLFPLPPLTEQIRICKFVNTLFIALDTIISEL